MNCQTGQDRRRWEEEERQVLLKCLRINTKTAPHSPIPSIFNDYTQKEQISTRDAGFCI